MNASWPGILRLVERLLAWPGASADVEDVAQEVFLAAWRGRAEFRGEAAWDTWVFAIAVRRSRNAARARRRRERWFGRLLTGAKLDETSGSPGIQEAGGVSTATREALSGLRHDDREILVLRYLEERAPAEIMALLDLSRAAVDGRLSRARARLKERLAPSESGDGGAA